MWELYTFKSGPVFFGSPCINTHTLHTPGLYAMGQLELASALTMDCRTGLFFHHHPRQYSTVQYAPSKILDQPLAMTVVRHTVYQCCDHSNISEYIAAHFPTDIVVL